MFVLVLGFPSLFLWNNSSSLITHFLVTESPLDGSHYLLTDWVSTEFKWHRACGWHYPNTVYVSVVCVQSSLEVFTLTDADPWIKQETVCLTVCSCACVRVTRFTTQKSDTLLFHQLSHGDSHKHQPHHWIQNIHWKKVKGHVPTTVRVLKAITVSNLSSIFYIYCFF